MKKDDILLEIKKTLFPLLVKDQMLLLSPRLMNDLFREELVQASDSKFNNCVLSKPAFDTLDHCNVKTMKDLYDTNVIHYLRFKGCGRKTCSRIEDFKRFFGDPVKANPNMKWVRPKHEYMSQHELETIMPLYEDMIKTMGADITEIRLGLKE